MGYDMHYMGRPHKWESNVEPIPPAVLPKAMMADGAVCKSCEETLQKALDFPNWGSSYCPNPSCDMWGIHRYCDG